MAQNEVYHRHGGRVTWETPEWLFREADREFGFTLDVCATADSAKCPRYFTVEQDGLLQEWAPAVCWCNPPYGKGIGDWLAKAAEEAQRGATVVCLVPARTDTVWWHANVWDERAHRPRPGVEVRFLRGRLKFGDKKGATAPFPSVIVVYRPPALG